MWHAGGIQALLLGANTPSPMAKLFSALALQPAIKQLHALKCFVVAAILYPVSFILLYLGGKSKVRPVQYL